MSNDTPKNTKFDVVTKIEPSEIEAMRDQVAKVTESEEKQVQEKSKKDELDAEGEKAKASQFKKEFVYQCCKEKDKGNGILFSHIFRNKYACLGKDYWLEFEKHSWKDIDISKVLHSVEKVVEEYQRISSIYAHFAKEAEDREEKEKVAVYRNRVRKLTAAIDRLHTMGGVKDTLEFSKANAQSTMISGDQLNNDPYILCCENGIVDLRTGDLRDGYPEDYITKKCAAKWTGLQAKAPTWEKMIYEILGENQEVAHYFHKLIGMAICGEITEKIFIILLGEDGDSGKTTIFEILFDILKNYVSPMPVEMLLDQRNPKNPDSPTPSIMSLKGKRLCWASEPGENRRFSVENIKLMSGNDSLTGRNPWDKDMSSFIPTHTLFLLTNHKMRASAHDQAFWSRLRLIECPFNFVANPDPNNPRHRKRVDGLQRKIVDEEASGVIAWIVRGYMSYLVEGIEPPEEVKKATAQYKREEDTLAEFIEQCLEEDLNNKIPGASLYEIFKNWFTNNYSKNVMTGTSFGRMASKHIEKVKTGGKVFYLHYKVTEEAVKNYENR